MMDGMVTLILTSINNNLPLVIDHVKRTALQLIPLWHMALILLVKPIDCDAVVPDRRRYI